MGTRKLWKYFPVKSSARDGQHTGVWTNQFVNVVPCAAISARVRCNVEAWVPPNVQSRSSVSTMIKLGSRFGGVEWSGGLSSLTALPLAHDRILEDGQVDNKHNTASRMSFVVFAWIILFLGTRWPVKYMTHSINGFWSGQNHCRISVTTPTTDCKYISLSTTLRPVGMWLLPTVTSSHQLPKTTKLFWCR